MELYNNIDVVQFNIKQGVEEYYIPKNVNWKDRIINKVVLVVAPSDDLTVLSPIDGQTELLCEADITDLYLDLYAADSNQIARNLLYTNILHTNNHVLSIGQKLSLNLSRLFFTTSPVKDGCILLYIYYGGKDVEEPEVAKESVTVTIPLAANGKTSLQDIVDNYIYMQPHNIKGVYFWDWQEKPVYLTLRYADNIHVLNNILSSLCRPPMYDMVNVVNNIRNTKSSLRVLYRRSMVQVNPLLLDNINIDMLNSFVQNGQNKAVEVKLTILY